MSIEKVRSYLKKYNAEDRIMEFEESSATVELAAHAVGVIPARIAKTLSFKKEDGCILVVTAGDQKIDNSKFKKVFGMKAKMLTADEVITMTGYAVGGVCPFAIPKGVGIYLDESLRRFETVFPAAGNSSSAVRLTCQELEDYSKADGWVDVCKPGI